MCRDNDHGGRRCPGDSSAARKARRYAQAAKAAQGTALASSTRTEPEPPPAQIEKPLEEQLREKAEAMRTFFQRFEDEKRQLAILGHQMNQRGASIMERRDAQAAAIAEMSFPDGLINERLAQYGALEVDWTSVESMIVELGAETDRWLDEQLLDQHTAIQDARQAHEDARAALKAAEAGEPGPFFVRPDDPEATVEIARAKRKVREEYVATHIEPARKAVEQSWKDAKSAETAYWVRKRELLARLRPMGGDLAWETAGVGTPKRVEKHIQRAADMLPADWVTMSNDLTENSEGTAIHRLRVRESSVRNHYVSHRTIRKREYGLDRGTFEYTSEKLTPEIFNEKHEPHRSAVPEEEWTEREREDMRYRPGAVVAQKYDVAFPGMRHRSTGRVLVDDDGNLRLEGRSAQGWERFEYTDYRGETSVCWRKPKRRVKSEEFVRGFAELTIPKGAEESSTALHEMIHRSENVNPRIGKLESEFVRRRTTHEDGTRHELEKYYPTSKGEWVRPDDFIDRYIGKDYRSSAYFEVMSMGVEAALYGNSGGFAKTQPDKPRDDDHHAFVLGTLLSA